MLLRWNLFPLYCLRGNFMSPFSVCLESTPSPRKKLKQRTNCRGSRAKPRKLIKHPEWTMNETQNSSSKWRTKGILTIPIYFRAFFVEFYATACSRRKKVVLTVSILVMASLSRWDFLNWFFSVPGIYICSRSSVFGTFSVCIWLFKMIEKTIFWLLQESVWKLKPASIIPKFRFDAKCRKLLYE